MPEENTVSLHEKSYSHFFRKFSPFLLFLTSFKFGAGLHYTLMSPFGERLFPLWLVGLMIGLAALAQLLLDIPAGHMLDTYGYRKMLKITTARIFQNFKSPNGSQSGKLSSRMKSKRATSEIRSLGKISLRWCVNIPLLPSAIKMESSVPTPAAKCRTYSTSRSPCASAKFRRY